MYNVDLFACKHAVNLVTKHNELHINEEKLLFFSIMVIIILFFCKLNLTQPAYNHNANQIKAMLFIIHIIYYSTSHFNSC